MNKYEKWYKDITKRGQTRLIEMYTEMHHIIPRSLGGLNSKENITNLTAREHFICHWLLTKIYKNGEEHEKMIYALRLMRAENKNQFRYYTKITARVYENLKIEYSKIQSENMIGVNNPMYGKTHSTEVKKQISNRMKIDNPVLKDGVIEKIRNKKLGSKREAFNQEWLDNLSKNHKSKRVDFNGALSEDTKKKIGDKIRGRKQSEEEKLARSLANKGKTREKKLCPHCNEMIAVNTYARWHGDNCKKKV